MVVAVSRLGCSAVATAINRPPATRTIPLQRRSGGDERPFRSAMTVSCTLSTSFTHAGPHRVLRLRLGYPYLWLLADRRSLMTTLPPRVGPARATAAPVAGRRRARQ